MPKVIILNDFLEKLVNTGHSENIFDTVFEVIKHEYTNKMDQNVGTHVFDRKIVGEPSLMEKDQADTGVLTLKIISDPFQGKPAVKKKFANEEIQEIRANIEAVLSLNPQDEDNRNIISL